MFLYNADFDNSNLWEAKLDEIVINRILGANTIISSNLSSNHS